MNKALKAHDTEFVYCPFGELPEDADPTSDRPSRFTYGSDIFGGSKNWIIVENGTEPVKVYKVPMPVSRILNSLMKLRYEAGQRDAQEAVRRAIGLRD